MDNGGSTAYYIIFLKRFISPNVYTVKDINGNCSFCIRTKVINSYQQINFNVYQTSSSVLLTTTTRWGGSVQQLGIHIWKMVTMLRPSSKLRACDPTFLISDADGFPDTFLLQSGSLDGSFKPSQLMVWLHTSAWSVNTD